MSLTNVNSTAHNFENLKHLKFQNQVRNLKQYKSTFVSQAASLSSSSSVRAFLAGGGPSPTGALAAAFVSTTGAVEVAGDGMEAATGAPAERTASGVCGITGTGIIGTPIGG